MRRKKVRSEHIVISVTSDDEMFIENLKRFVINENRRRKAHGENQFSYEVTTHRTFDLC